MIGIIDYGMGNLMSVQNALNNIYVESAIVKNPKEVSSFKSIILPGVGSFGKAMDNLNKDGWTSEIQDFASEKPILGICLGMQLLFSLSNEGGENHGLNLIPGLVKKIPSEKGLILPHVGWNDLKIVKEVDILEGINQEIDVYFVHSYECLPDDNTHVICTTSYGKEIVAGVKFKNLYGFQFHPEKSQPSGLKILENFSKITF